LLESALQIDINSLSSDTTLLASVAIILGTVFVVIEMKDNRRMVEATLKQANTAALQLKQNYELSTVDLVTSIYEFANSMEFQRSWQTVLEASVTSYEGFEELAEEQRLAFAQVASCFESIGLLVEKDYVKQELVDDMFAIRLAWGKLEPFIMGMRERHKAEDYYFWFEKLYKRLTQPS